MKSVLVIAMFSIAATAYAQQPARPIVHATEQAAVYAEPSATSKLVLVTAPTDDLYAGEQQGEWTRVEHANGAGWIATARIAPAASAPGAAPQTDDEPKRRPAGKRFVNGFRLGWMYVGN